MSVKKRNILIAAAAALCALCIYPAAVQATEDSESWVSWTDEKREEAWMVYTTSEWKTLEDYINFESLGTSAHADVPDSLRESLEQTMKDTVSAGSTHGAYGDEAYVELMLAIVDQMSGVGSHDEYDVCYVKKYIDPDANITSEKQSIRILFKRIIDCENAYIDAYGDPPSIYQTTESLAALIQGVIYGPGYTSATPRHTTEEANSYYNANKDSIPWAGFWSLSHADFADKVLSHYSAMEIS